MPSCFHSSIWIDKCCRIALLRRLAFVWDEIHQSISFCLHLGTLYLFSWSARVWIHRYPIITPTGTDDFQIDWARLQGYDCHDRHVDPATLARWTGRVKSHHVFFFLISERWTEPKMMYIISIPWFLPVVGCWDASNLRSKLVCWYCWGLRTPLGCSYFLVPLLLCVVYRDHKQKYRICRVAKKLLTFCGTFWTTAGQNI